MIPSPQPRNKAKTLLLHLLAATPLSLSPSAADAMAAAARSRAAATWARLLSLRSHNLAGSNALPRNHHLAPRITPPRRHLAFSASAGGARPQIQSERAVHELLAEVERERERERKDRRAGDGDKEGDPVEDQEEEEEDYLGVKPLIEKLERRKAKEAAADEDGYWEPTDSDSDEDDERYTPDAIKKRVDEFERKCKRHGELLRSFAEAGNRPIPPISTTPSLSLPLKLT